MSNEQGISLNELLKSQLEFANPAKRIAEQLEAIRQPMTYNFPKLKDTFPKNITNIGQSLAEHQKRTREMLNFADTYSELFVMKGIIQNQESLKEMMKQVTSLSVSLPTNTSFLTRLQLTDSIISIKKGFAANPNYGNLLKKATAIPYTNLYNNIFENFNEDEFKKTFSSHESVTDDVDSPVETPENNYENMSVVHPEFVQASEKLSSCVQITNHYVTHHHHYSAPEANEAQGLLKKYGIPALIGIASLLHQIGMMTDPISDTIYVKTFEKIVHTINEHPVEQHDLDIKLDELNSLDSVDTEKTSS